MLAESNNFILLLLGALIVIGGLLLGYTMTRPKTAPHNTRAGDDASDVAREDQAQPATSDEPVIVQAAPPQPPADEKADEEPQPAPADELSDDIDDSPAAELDSALQQLDPQIKHRIVYRFMPHLKGMLFEGETLDGYLADAAARAMQRGWDSEKLAAAAQTGKWKRPRSEQASPEA